MEADALDSLDSRTPGTDEGGRAQYASKVELILTLVGYAVGLGNVWRFPYLCYTYGGGAFLVPYFCALAVLGLPLFVLEMGLGQMFRQGTLGVWSRMGLPKFRGVGAAATVTTFMVSLYYQVILAWTIYYLGRTFEGIFSGGVLPWDDQRPGFVCPETVLVVRNEVVGNPYLVVHKTGLFNTSYTGDFWCPESGVPTRETALPEGFSLLATIPSSCPASAAVSFWETEALQQSSGLDDFGGIPLGLWISYNVSWILTYICIFKGVASSGKVVYVTATLPYIVLFIFFWRAITLPNALTGVKFYVEPDFSLLGHAEVWMRAVTQIFFSLGVGFGSLIAFASYGNRHSDFARDALNVSLINCATSFFAGFVVFPVLGFLAEEMSEINPCISSETLDSLSAVGLSGAGLAFIAFPIAVSQMPIGWLWSLLFFLMLLCLGIDSEFAMVESVITVLSDAGVGQRLPRPVFTAGVCAVSYVLGLIFITRGGVYWFQLFDYYSCVIAMFVVCLLECLGLMWAQPSNWPVFRAQVELWTGRHLGCGFWLSWRYVVPSVLAVLLCAAFTEGDLMDAKNSVRYPQGTGYYPEWSIYIGWFLGLLPIIVLLVFLAQTPPPSDDDWDDPIHEPEMRDDVGLSLAHEREVAKRAPDLEGATPCTAFDTEGGGSARSSPETLAKSEPEAECAPCSSGEDAVGPDDIVVRMPYRSESRDTPDVGEKTAESCEDYGFEEMSAGAADKGAPDASADVEARTYGKASSSVASSDAGSVRQQPERRIRKRSPEPDDGVPVCGFLCGAVLQRGLPPKAAKRWW